MEDKIYINLDNYNPNRISRPVSKPKEQMDTMQEELPAEKTEILLSDILLIGVHTINVMGTKAGDDISKLEAVLYNQGIKYRYSDNVDHPSKLLVVDDNYVFTVSGAAAKFNMEVLCDDGYKISSYFFRSEPGSEYGAMIDAMNDMSGTFLRSRDVKSKKKVMDEVLCVRQDFYTRQNVAKIERNNGYVTLEIMSKSRFEDIVLRWYEKSRWRDTLLYVLYAAGLFGVPVYMMFFKQQIHVDGLVDLWRQILAFILYVICWWFLYTPICWFIASFFWKDEVSKDVRMGCVYPALFIICLTAGGVLYDKCTHKETVNALYSTEEPVPTETVNSRSSKTETQVYICTGPQSRRYHNTRYCRGLESCSDDIELVDVSEAEDKGRTPCRICY